MSPSAELNSAKQRDANLDLLRIISMLLIVFLHSIDHSGVLEAAESCPGPMYFYIRFTYCLCQVCVNCYVMLSGYYLVNSRFRIQKLVVLWMETVFYSFALKLLFMLTGQTSFSLFSLISCFFPVVTGRYWFITIYVGMYLISPFLNKLVRAMNQKEHTRLNLCLFVLFSLWISLYPSFAGMNSGGGWGLAWFVVLYLAAAWFRLYYTPKHKPAVLFGAFLLIPLLIAAGQVAANVLGIGILQRIISNWFRYDSAPVYLMTIALFSAFLNIRIKNKRLSTVICFVAPLTLGVYLIHAHANVSPWIWQVAALPEKMSSVQFPLIQFGIVFIIFFTCAAVDILRRCTIGKAEHAAWLQRCCEGITRRIISLTNHCEDATYTK